MPTAAKGEFDPEQPVIEAIRTGDRYAFEELVRRHGRWVRSIVFGVLGRRDGIDDVAQQVWTTVWQRIGELRDATRWKPWLYRLARNAALDAGREITRRRKQVVFPSRGLDEADSAGTTVERLPGAASERSEAVMQAIQALPALYREPFVLRHVNGWGYQQIAEAMEMPVDSVETRLVRARRMLREALKDLSQ